MLLINGTIINYFKDNVLPSQILIIRYCNLSFLIFCFIIVYFFEKTRYKIMIKKEIMRKRLKINYINMKFFLCL